MGTYRDHRGRTHSLRSRAESSISLTTGHRQLDTQSYSHNVSPYRVTYRSSELRSFADDDYVMDMSAEYWPHKILYCDHYKRKFIGYSNMHKYWKNPFGWEHGLPRYNITYQPFGWNSFKRYRYVRDPPLVRVP